MPCLIWAAGLIELIRLNPINLAFLLTLQFVNGLVLYIQDKQSRSAIATIKKSLSTETLVKRDKEWVKTNVTNLVKGDRIQLSPGDILPADCILGPGECMIDQSMLTGEARQVYKQEGNKVYMGSICKKGEIEANVCATGIETFFGKTNFMASKVSKKGNIQKTLDRIAFFLMIVSSVIVSIILIIFLYKGNEFLESLSTSVVMLVLSFPIAMQAVCASTLAVGAKRLYKKKTVVSRLASIEELAGADILCVHKAGIFTKNEPIVMGQILFNSYKMQDLWIAAYLTSRKDVKNPIDRAIVEYFNNEIDLSFDLFEEEDYVQYDPKQKMNEVTIRNIENGEILQYCKGAVQVVLALTKEYELEPDIADCVYKCAQKGYSVIAVAKRENDNWRMVGLVMLFDSFFEDISEQVNSIKKLGVRLLFLTGDQMLISKYISNAVGLGDLIFNAELFNNDTTTVKRELLDSIIIQSDGFAEVYPEHKFTIVKILQNKGKKVAITGVSINDAPALKRANVGLAAYGATDAAKSSSDMIFSEPGPWILAQSIIKSRRIFTRSKTYGIYRIACSLQLLIFFFVSLAAINPEKDFKCKGTGCKDMPNTSAFPVIALVIIALLNDITMISISSDRATHSKKPCRLNLGTIFVISFTLGTISFFSSFAFLLVCLSHMDESDPNFILNYFGIDSYNYEQVLTAVFLKLSVSNYLTIFSVRSEGWFCCSRPGVELTISGITALSITTLLCNYWVLNIQPKNSVVVSNMESISWRTTLLVWVFCFTIFLLQDVMKMTIYKTYNNMHRVHPDLLLEKMCLMESMKTNNKIYSQGIVTERSKHVTKT